MISRKAIIIGNAGGYRKLKLLKGVEVDIENYNAYLSSKAGGQWHSSEILILKDKSAKEVQEAIKESKADYTLIVFSGHGFINSFDANDHVCLLDEDISIGQLVSPSQKQTIVIDACRDYFTQEPADIRKAIFEAYANESFERETRQIFDDAITAMPTGILLVFSTQPNQSAGDDAFKGGHFSYSFIKAGRDWWQKGKGILTIDVAVDTAENIMQSTFITDQKPAMGGQTRRLTFPPFAVSKT